MDLRDCIAVLWMYCGHRATQHSLSLQFDASYWAHLNFVQQITGIAPSFVSVCRGMMTISVQQLEALTDLCPGVYWRYTKTIFWLLWGTFRTTCIVFIVLLCTLPSQTTHDTVTNRLQKGHLLFNEAWKPVVECLSDDFWPCNRRPDNWPRSWPMQVIAKGAHLLDNGAAKHKISVVDPHDSDPWNYDRCDRCMRRSSDSNVHIDMMWSNPPYWCKKRWLLAYTMNLRMIMITAGFLCLGNLAIYSESAVSS